MLRVPAWEHSCLDDTKCKTKITLSWLTVGEKQLFSLVLPDGMRRSRPEVTGVNVWEKSCSRPDTDCSDTDLLVLRTEFLLCPALIQTHQINPNCYSTIAELVENNISNNTVAITWAAVCIGNKDVWLQEYIFHGAICRMWCNTVCQCDFKCWGECTCPVSGHMAEARGPCHTEECFTHMLHAGTMYAVNISAGLGGQSLPPASCFKLPQMSRGARPKLVLQPGSQTCFIQVLSQP